MVNFGDKVKIKRYLKRINQLVNELRDVQKALAHYKCEVMLAYDRNQRQARTLLAAEQRAINYKRRISLLEQALSRSNVSITTPPDFV